MHSRPRRRYQLDYLGMTTENVRFVRDFLISHRLGVTMFEWIHPTAFDTVPVSNTTPVVLTYFHEYQTGQWVVVSGATPNTSIIGVWPVQRLAANAISLTGTVAGGASTCDVRTYLPRARGFFPEGEWPGPAKLMGPESINSARGRFSFSVIVEEQL